MENIKEKISRMKRMATMLVPYTHPVGSWEDERDVLILKQHETIIDGYDVMLCLSDADYGDHHLWSLQIQSVFSPFLPFNMVCKIGKMFFGDKHVSFLQFAKNGKKIYCWTIKRRGKKILPPEKNSEIISYEGFDYSLMNSDSVDLH